MEESDQVQNALSLEPSPPGQQQYSGEVEEEGEDDTDAVLPKMLFEQGSHELICPLCDHIVTGEVILQKRKRGSDPDQPEELRPHGIQAKPSATSSTDEDELSSALQEQTNYELLCPDCESCITHAVILQKRKRATSKPDPETTGRKPWTAGAAAHRGRQQWHRDRTPEEEDIIAVDDGGDPPQKRHRRSDRVAADKKDPQAKEIRRMLQNQRVYDLSCPDCTSRINHKLVLKRVTSASGRPVGLLEKRARRRRKSVDDNPWKTRYKLLTGHSKPTSASQARARKDLESRGAKHGQARPAAAQQPEEQEDPQSLGAKHGKATPQPEERGDLESLGAKDGKATPAAQAEEGGVKSETAIWIRSPTQPDMLENPQLAARKYGSAATTDNSSLREPLLPAEQQQQGDEEATGETAETRVTILDRFRALKRRVEELIGQDGMTYLLNITYFLIILLLYCVLYVIHIL